MRQARESDGAGLPFWQMRRRCGLQQHMPGCGWLVAGLPIYWPKRPPALVRYALTASLSIVA